MFSPSHTHTEYIFFISYPLLSPFSCYLSMPISVTLFLPSLLPFLGLYVTIPALSALSCPTLAPPTGNSTRDPQLHSTAMQPLRKRGGFKCVPQCVCAALEEIEKWLNICQSNMNQTLPDMNRVFSLVPFLY